MPNVRLMPTATEVAVTNVFVIGKNYLADAAAKRAQREKPLIVCMKPTSSVLLEPGVIRLPEFSREVHFEIELLVLIGTPGSDIPVDRAMEHVAGFGVGLDLTAFDLQQEAQRTGTPWMRCKGFAHGAPMSDFVERQQVEAPEQARFSLHVNGEVRQQGNAGEMVNGIAEIVSKLSVICPLTRGDVIFTGTPTGAGPLASGDRLELRYLDLVQARFSVA